MMKKLYHDAIFYPREKESLEPMTAKLEKKEKAKAIIVPHQDLRRCYELYREAFSHIEEAKRIIILTPLHSEKLLKDEGKFLFEGDEGTVETALGMVDVKSLGLDKAEYYAEEEYAPELILPYLAGRDAEVFIVYAAIKSADESKKLAKFIEKWNDEYTVFIISSNLTSKMAKDEMLSEREKAAKMIVDGEKLMESYRKGRISICATGIVDAINRALDGKWHLIGLSNNDESTGHGAFYKEYV